MLNRTREVLENAVQPVGPQSVSGSVTINNFTGEPRIVTEELVYTNVDFQSSNLTTQDLKIGTDDLENNITEIHNALKNLLDELEGLDCFYYISTLVFVCHADAWTPHIRSDHNGCL